MPQAVWLFAPDPAASPRAHPDLIDACHEHGLKVFVQVGTVAAAREAARDGADVIVAQGADAGGHQFARAASVVSLVPEVRLMLREEFAGRDVALVAAGGIAHEDAVVAAVVLGEAFPSCLFWTFFFSLCQIMEFSWGADVRTTRRRWCGDGDEVHPR